MVIEIEKNVKIKDDVTLADRVNVIKQIVKSYFTGNEYTPYYATIGETIAIATILLDGVEFESDDYVYETVMSHETLNQIVSQYKRTSDFAEIRSQVKDMVEYEKQRRVHKNDALDKISEFCDVVAKSFANFANLNLSQMTQEDMQMARDFISQLKGKNITETTLSNALRKAANKYKTPDSEIYEGQRKRIAEQQEQIQEKDKEIIELRKWKQQHEARNVLSGK